MPITPLPPGSICRNSTRSGTPAQPSTACESLAEAERMAAVLEPAIIRNMARSPEITVAAVTETDGRFLVVEERINRRLVFNQPAGHVAPGETLPDAVVRETREKTAWGFEPKALIGVYLWRNPSSGRSTMRFPFHATVPDTHP